MYNVASSIDKQGGKRPKRMSVFGSTPAQAKDAIKIGFESWWAAFRGCLAPKNHPQILGQAAKRRSNKNYMGDLPATARAQRSKTDPQEGKL